MELLQRQVKRTVCDSATGLWQGGDVLCGSHSVVDGMVVIRHEKQMAFFFEAEG